LLLGSPADADAHLSIGHALKTLGQTEAAIDSYRRAAACRADFGDAYWSLANLKTYRFTPQEMTSMQAALAAPSTGLVDRYHLCFALARPTRTRESLPARSITTGWATSSSGRNAVTGPS